MANDFHAHFRTIKENKASSPSGCHFGHYTTKAKLDNSFLHKIIMKIVHTALITVNPLPRWQQCIQVMLEKGKGPKIKVLQIIQLVEGDLNWVLKLIWGYRLNKTAHNLGLYNSAQFAVPRKTCGSMILSKIHVGA